ncbi:MAG: hypothetical protein HYY42_04980 [Chloroflexi bacterium]|nr:hypothetical protein [Chloroflexota bacterium]
MADRRRITLLGVFVALVVMVACGGSESPSGPSKALEVLTPGAGTEAARWDVRAPMSTARTSAAGGVIGGKLYVVGGIDQRENRHLSGLEVYDPATNSWSIKAPMALARYLPRAVGIGAKLYVVGGCVGWCAPTTDQVEVYDPAAAEWTPLRAMAYARGGADVATANGRIVAAGGCCGGTQTETSQMGSRVEVYDPAADAWTTKAAHYVGSGGAAGSIDGRVYVAGSTVAEVYDPAGDVWAPIPPMPTPREYPVGGVIDGKFYVAGGSAVSGGAPSAPPTPALSPAPPPLSALLAGSKGITFRVTYRITVTGAAAGASGTQTWYVKGGASRFDFTIAQGSASVYVIPDGAFLCSAAGGQAICLAMPAASALQQNPSAALDVQLHERPDRFTATYEGTRQIVGQTAQCYTVVTASSGSARVCYTATGIPLFIGSTAPGVTTTMEATDLGTTVSDADLTLPAAPTRLPGAP